MEAFQTFILYAALFIVVYFEVFLLITLFDHSERKHSAHKKGLKVDPGHEPHIDGDICIDPNKTYPTVSIIIPVWNEEKTVEKTVHSLLALEYPKDKLDIMIVDDGSKDNTWELIQKFKDNPQIKLHQKENGGKYTALNHGITHSTSDFIGCLDADSFVDSKALLHMVPFFENPEIAAVTPSMKVQNPDNILGLIQNAEYNKGIFTRKIFALLDAQYITPGPFSIFRKEVFKTVGLYRHAHNTEDLEMALRLQEHHFRIVNAEKALVYTVGPRTIYKLYRQRVRWTGGFIQNALDYRRMILNPKYGNLGMLILPVAMYGIVAGMITLCVVVYHAAINIIEVFERARLVGWNFSFSSFDIERILFSIRAPLFVGILMTIGLIFTVWYGKHAAGVKDKKMIDIVYYMMFFSLLSPFWLVKSVYNTIRQRDAAWR